jgi:hypothetical protein
LQAITWVISKKTRFHPTGGKLFCLWAIHLVHYSYLRSFVFFQYTKGFTIFYPKIKALENVMGKKTKKHARHTKPKKHRTFRQKHESTYHDFPVTDDEKVASERPEFFPPTTSQDVLTFSQYEITYEPLQEWPPYIQKHIEEIHPLLTEDPEAVISRLEGLIQKYPYVPTFYNYMAVAYGNIDEKDLSNFWVYEAYRLYPDYLFAKTNLAHIYLRQGRLDEVEKIFGGKFDLKQIYPRREVFHVTEAVAFFGVLGEFFWLKSDRRTANLFYKALHRLSPRNFYARWLQRRLHPVGYFLATLFSWDILNAIFRVVVYLIVAIISLPFLFLEILWKNTVGRLVRKIQ